MRCWSSAKSPGPQRSSRSAICPSHTLASASGIWHSCWLREGDRLGVRRVTYHDLESSLLPSQDFLFICPDKSDTSSSHHWLRALRVSDPELIYASQNPCKVLRRHPRIINCLNDEVWKQGSEWTVEQFAQSNEAEVWLMRVWPQNPTLPKIPHGSSSFISGAGATESLACSPCPEEPKNGKGLWGKVARFSK